MAAALLAGGIWRYCVAGISTLAFGTLGGSATAQSTQVLPQTSVTGESAGSSLTSNGGSEIIRPADLVKFGQVTLGEALNRFGATVTVMGRNGEQELTIAGLGNGYTQILLNGSKAPRGFRLDSLPADAIERVEIIRSPTSEAAARGIAGTINVILKRASAQNNTRSIKASHSSGWVEGHAVDGTFSTTDQGRSIFVQASDRRTVVDRSSLAERTVVNAGQREHGFEHLQGTATVHERVLIPKIEWREALRTVSFEAQAQTSRQARRNFQQLQWDSLGDTAIDGYALTSIRRDAYAVTANVKDSALMEGVTLESKLTTGYSRRNSEGVISNGDTAGTNKVYLAYPSTDKSVGFRVKAAVEVASNSSYEFGIHGDRVARNESEVRTEILRQEYRYQVNVSDIAAFVNWSTKFGGGDIQTGIRQELIELRYAELPAAETSRRFNISAPQVSWRKSFGKDLPTFSAAITRAARIPDESDFSTRTYFATFNSQSSPDRQGNPSLRPELATSLELAVATPKKAPVDFKGSLAVKALEHVITEELLSNGENWIIRPTNAASGRLVLLSLGVRRNIQWQSIDQIESTFGAALNATDSRVQTKTHSSTSIPNTSPYQFTLSADVQRRGQDAWAAGANFVYRASQKYEEFGGATIERGPKRILDLFFSRTLTSGINIRLSANNLLQRKSQSHFYRTDGSNSYEERAHSRDGATFRLALESSL